MKIGIFGSSGFSREVADICTALNYEEIVFIDMIEKEDAAYFGYPLVSEKKVPILLEEGFVFIIGVGENNLRKKIYNKFKHIPFINLIHPDVSMGGSCEDQLKGRIGNIFTAGTRLTNNIEIGNFGVYNLNCTVGHDCIIKDFVNIAPGSNVSGNVYLSKGVYVGTGSSIIQGKTLEEKLKIGENSIIGAGSVVTKEVASNVIVKGIPAR